MLESDPQNTTVRKVISIPTLPLPAEQTSVLCESSYYERLFKELMRQTQLSFNLNLLFTGLVVLIVFICAALLIEGRTSEATATGISGISGAVLAAVGLFYKAARDANLQLYKMVQRDRDKA